MASMRRQSHETGPCCNCKRRCCEEVGAEGRAEIIKRMNQMNSNDEINSYLSGLVIILPVQRRRPRNREEDASFRDATFSYRVRFLKYEQTVEVEVCKKAFTPNRVFAGEKLREYVNI